MTANSNELGGFVTDPDTGKPVWTTNHELLALLGITPAPLGRRDLWGHPLRKGQVAARHQWDTNEARTARVCRTCGTRNVKVSGKWTNEGRA